MRRALAAGVVVVLAVGCGADEEGTTADGSSPIPETTASGPDASGSLIDATAVEPTTMAVEPTTTMAVAPDSTSVAEADDADAWSPTAEEALLAGTNVYDVVVEVLECGGVPAHTDPVRTVTLEFDEAGRHAQWVEFGGEPVLYLRTGPNEFGQTIDASDGGRDTFTTRLTADGFVDQYDDDGVPCFRYTHTLATG